MEREDEQGKAQNKSNLPEHATLGKVKLLGISLIPIVVLAAMIAYIVGPAQQYLGVGIPLPEVTIERIEFREGDLIVAYIRNTGPMDIAVAQADVNDRIQPAAIEPSRDMPRLAEARVIIPFPWNAGEPYEIGITTSDGTRFSKSVEAAAPAISPDIDQAAFFALVGTYVGIIPVLIGLLWLPFIRRLSMGKYNFFLALTAGLLVFLGIDALAESNEIAEENIAGVFDGTILIAMVMILSFLVLMYAAARLAKRSSDSADVEESTSSFTAGKQDRGGANAELDSKNMSQRRLLQSQLVKPLAISLMISIGIGLHNFGEGLAIGAAVVLGEVALSTFLIIGFMVHNTTEGLAIVSPLAKVKVKRIVARLAVFGLIAGAPTIVGAWIGGFLYSPIAAIIFLSVGAGAIFQVVFAIFQWMMRRKETVDRGGSGTILSDPYLVGGFAAGMLIMYVTGILVPS